MSIGSPNERLHYDNDTPAELREFIQARSLTATGLGTIPKSALVARLRELDRNQTFRLLDLPPELRLQVYRYALTGIGHLEPGLLRACRLVYAEAEPVLYGDNGFCVNVALCGHMKGFEKVAASGADRDGNEFYYTSFTRPGHGVGFLYSPNDKWNSFVTATDGPLDKHMTFSPTVNILRNVRNLHIRLDDEVERHCFHSRGIIACLCIMLSGHSKLKKITFDIHADVAALEKSTLMDLFWPVGFLRKEVELEFDGKYTALKAGVEGYRDILQGHSYRLLQAPGDLIAKAHDMAVVKHSQTRRPVHYRRSSFDLNGVLRRFADCIRRANTFNRWDELVNIWELLERCVNEREFRLS